jgi:hypothetical protein
MSGKKWSDGSAWDYEPPNSAEWNTNECLDNGHCKRFNDWNGTATTTIADTETRIAMSHNYGDQKWEDWGTGVYNLHAICRSNDDVSDCTAMGGVSRYTTCGDGTQESVAPSATANRVCECSAGYHTLGGDRTTRTCTACAPDHHKTTPGPVGPGLCTAHSARGTYQVLPA